MTAEIEKSTRKNKKYMVNYNNKWIHFGDIFYEQYRDSTPLELYKDQNHYDKKRRDAYRKRATHIKDKNGDLTFNNKNSANYWSIKFLW